MPDKNLISMGSKSFEDLKKINEYGAEYWSAREIQPLLGYTQWRRFEDAIKRAITSCKQSGNAPENHFAGAGKMVDLGSGSVREVFDYNLSRFACYLIAQNGDPRKPEIANAQKYFAIQARRQEISDAIAADVERLELRKQTAEEFKALSGAAREAGVHDKMFGISHDAGYKGMYGGMGRNACVFGGCLLIIRDRSGTRQSRLVLSELVKHRFAVTSIFLREYSWFVSLNHGMKI